MLPIGNIKLFFIIVIVSAKCEENGMNRKDKAEQRDFIDEWFADLDYRLGQMNSAGASLEWRMAVDPGEEVTLLARKLGVVRTAWRNSWCAQTKDAVDVTLLTESQRRQIYLMCRGLKYTPHQTKEMTNILGNLQDIYSSTKVCRRHVEKCYSGEPDLERLMRESRDPAELLWAWQQWRRAVGPKAKPLYAALVELQNQGARNNGYSDAGEVWREELETDNLEGVVEELYQSVEPLYILLHAVVRFRLVQYYGEDNIDPRGPIPAHLLGNMWAQNWEPLLDLMIPGLKPTDIGDELRKRNYTPWDMVHKAEDFYTSLGLERMTPTFWIKSQLGQSNVNATCHGTAANMYTPDDYRMLLCAKVSEEDFYVIHHEMGHIEYYMAYKHQPSIFKDGANSAFHESVGDAVMYGVMVPQHLQRLGLINDSNSSQDSDIVFLLRQALAKIPQIPFGLIIDKWRWAVFRGEVKPQDYNAAWWQLRLQYQGLAPPVARSKDDFDPAAKFHIPDNTPYVRYFLSSFLQVQMFESMCKAAVFGKVTSAPVPIPLHRCDIYGSKEAGNKLRDMMSLGCSRSWQDALEVLTGTRQYDPKPLLQYYTPLYDWLLDEIQRYNIPVGWN